MATLLRSRRRCDTCDVTAHCQLLQLLVPLQRGDHWTYEWYSAWLCPPCKRACADGFAGRAVRELRVVAS